jgi:hypothetical protein
MKIMGDHRPGRCYFDVADCTALATDTHDFESRYLDSMIGAYPEEGLDNKIVPPDQSEAFREACVPKGIKHEYVTFEGEGHGFIRPL